MGRAPQVYKDTGSASAYFVSAWNYIDLLSISISFSSICIWAFIAIYAEFVFDINLTYDVYSDPPHKWYALSHLHIWGQDDAIAGVALDRPVQAT